MYRVNEIFRSPQGEGKRAGQMSLFLRFTGCNLRCAMQPGPKSPGGFDCDTEFTSGRSLTMDEIVQELHTIADGCTWVVMTGGEPGLQVDIALIDRLHAEGFSLAIETNGSVELAEGIDWITVSPKVAEHCIRQLTATEVKYVRGYGQALPVTPVVAKHYLISPTFNGLEIDQRALQWCKDLVKGTEWELSFQEHKFWGVR